MNWGKESLGVVMYKERDISGPEKDRILNRARFFVSWLTAPMGVDPLFSSLRETYPPPAEDFFSPPLKSSFSWNCAEIAVIPEQYGSLMAAPHSPSQSDSFPSREKCVPIYWPAFLHFRREFSGSFLSFFYFFFFFKDRCRWDRAIEGTNDILNKKRSV